VLTENDVDQITASITRIVYKTKSPAKIAEKVRKMLKKKLLLS